MSRIYFLGIGGTLMGSLAQLAAEMGHEVSGSDDKIYPPMSDQLRNANIETHEGFSPNHLTPQPDLVVIGNAKLPRGNDGIEYILNEGIRYVSGAEWLGTTILQDRWVIAASGTHGKTTTASMLAWILEHSGLKPGYLIGGVPKNFSQSARLGTNPFFVVEADEYDCSFFDRRSKFIHYRPRTLIINNIEYEHADIFSDISEIQEQFHHLLRAIPSNGHIIAPMHDDKVDEVLSLGCWSKVSRFGDPHNNSENGSNDDRWTAQNAANAGNNYTIYCNEREMGRVSWELLGDHNVKNGLAAIAAASKAGIKPEVAIDALNNFKGVMRRLELIAEIGNTKIYDDFAHHPTAIRTTLQGLRHKVGNEEIIAVIEPRSHTMSLGALSQELTTCCSPADSAYWFRGENIKWDLAEVVSKCVVPASQFDNLDALIDTLAKLPDKKRHIVIMSNGAFGGIYKALPKKLNELKNFNKKQTNIS
tara:strand:+ start:2948 stop:4372 length:1425 start_codon:yes stop_codon:yes gene_type:complete